MNLRQLAIGISFAVSAAAAGSQQPSVQLYAAGSLRAPMTDIVQAFSASGGPPVKAVYGPSGLLRERIEKGEPADVFASADMGNAQALAQAGRATPPVVFARNRLCALAAPDVVASADTLLDRMLDPQVKLGTSTPKGAHRRRRQTHPVTTHGRFSRRQSNCAPGRSRPSMPRRSS
jgi:ABC-type molybdate transport system substrate-binding protein